MKIVHAADLHLDSPLRGLERYDGAPVEQIRGATRRALENLVELCIAQEAALLLLAGDLYDGNWRDYSTGLFFSNQMARLRQAGVRVVWLRGNHDAASQITRYLELPSNVTELSTVKPTTVRFEDIGVHVHGQGYPKRAVEDDLAQKYPDAADGVFNVGLLHTAVGGHPEHATYAPCSLETLRSKGYDYWALGHVHTRAVLDTDPWIVFPGNLQGRHGREPGPKGATVLSLVDGRIDQVAHHALDVVRWKTITLDVTEVSAAADVIDVARSRFEQVAADAEGRTVAARVALRGTTPAHSTLVRDPEKWLNELRAAAVDGAGDALWVERATIETRAPLDVEALASRNDAIGQVARALRDPESRASLVETVAGIVGRLPLEAREGEDGLRMDDPDALRRIIEDVEQLLLPQLVDAGDES